MTDAQAIPSQPPGITSTPNRYVEITWIDCQGDAHGWTPVSELATTPCVVVTVGHLIEPPPRADHLTVALSVYDHDTDAEMQVDSVVHVPRAMVQNIRTLSADTLATPVLSFPHS